MSSASAADPVSRQGETEQGEVMLIEPAPASPSSLPLRSAAESMCLHSITLSREKEIEVHPPGSVLKWIRANRETVSIA